MEGLLHGGQTPNDGNKLDTSTHQQRNGGQLKHGEKVGNGHLKNNHAPDPWNLEGRALSALNRFGERARSVSDPEWLRRVQHHNAIMEPPTPVVERTTLSSLISEKGLNGALYVAGEVQFITRPLIYVLFIRKYGARSWIPWFLSLAVDLTGMGILSRITSSTGGSEEQQFNLSVPEKNEVKRRKLLWGKLESNKKKMNTVDLIFNPKQDGENLNALRIC